MNTLTMMKVADIRIDGGTQSRAEFDSDVMAEYADAIAAGAKMPPVTVFFDGSDHWLADGFHRLLAHLHIEALDIEASVVSGSRRDAILFSAGANDTHGKRRTNEDKHRAVGILLADAEWQLWSAREIAKRCCVSHDFVARLKSSLSSEDSEKAVTYKTKHGTEAVMKTANIGRTVAGPPKQPEHDLPTHSNAQSVKPFSLPRADEQSSPVPQERTASDDDDEILAELNSLRDQVDALHQEVKSLRVTDKDIEISRLSGLLINSENEREKLSDLKELREKELWRNAKILTELRKIFNCTDDHSLVAAARMGKGAK